MCHSSIFSFKSAPVKFFLRCCLFFLPLLLIGSAYELILWNSGEDWSISRVVEAQLKHPKLVWRRKVFSQFSETYKLLLVKHAQKEIMVTGSSRTLAFRKMFFYPMGERFINAGRLVLSLGDLSSLGKGFEERTLPRPKVLILGLDPWWLKSGSPIRSGFDVNYMPEDAGKPAAHISAITRLMSDGIFPVKLLDWRNNSRTPYCQEPARGLSAILKGSAFRGDGSTVHESIYFDFKKDPVYHDREKPPIIDRVRNHSDQFSPTAGIDWKKVDFLLSNLRKIRSLGIETFIFQPPFSDEVAREIQNDPELADWWSDFWNILPDVLMKNSFSCFGVSNPSRVGLDDRYMLDGFHPSEVFVATVLAEWLAYLPEESFLSGVDKGSLRLKLKGGGVLPVGFGCD